MTSGSVARDRWTQLLKKSRCDFFSTADVMRRPKKTRSASTFQSNELTSRPPTKLTNTYQLGPHTTLPVAKVELIIQQILEKYLQHEQYQSVICRLMAKHLSEVIRGRVKELLIPRYRLVCIVHIGELGDQSMLIAGRCLWDPSCDTFASCQFKNNSLFAVCSLYAVYLD